MLPTHHLTEYEEKKGVLEMKVRGGEKYGCEKWGEKVVCDFCPVPWMSMQRDQVKRRVNGGSNYDSLKVAKCLVF